MNNQIENKIVLGFFCFSIVFLVWIFNSNDLDKGFDNNIKIEKIINKNKEDIV